MRKTAVAPLMAEPCTCRVHRQICLQAMMDGSCDPQTSLQRRRCSDIEETSNCESSAVTSISCSPLLHPFATPRRACDITTWQGLLHLSRSLWPAVLSGAGCGAGRRG